MIRDIIERSGGAMIKILSDKTEKDRECIISINGSKENKIDALCFIMEQIECFKNGGPILQSGKSINENLAQQFKNSLPLHDQDLDPNATHPTSPPRPHDSEEEGMIEPEVEREEREREEREREEREREKRQLIERDLDRINPLKKEREYSRRSRSRSDSNSKY
jgi:hypothetical protein